MQGSRSSTDSCVPLSGWLSTRDLVIQFEKHAWLTDVNWSLTVASHFKQSDSQSAHSSSKKTSKRSSTKGVQQISYGRGSTTRGATSRASYEAGGGAYTTSSQSRKRRPRRRHRHVGRVIGIIVAIVLVLGGVTGYCFYRSAKAVKASATELMADLPTIMDSLKSGDTSSLETSVDGAVEKADYINAEVHTPLWDLMTFVPVVGEDVKSVQQLGEVASTLTNDVLVPISKNLNGVGLSELINDGSVNIDLLETLIQTLDQVGPEITNCGEIVDSMPEPHISQLQSVISKAKETIGTMGDIVTRIQPYLDILPEMLGANGQTRTYLVIAQNNSELRSTGGLPGSWGTISITDGKITMGEFTTILHQDGLKVAVTDEELACIDTNMDTDPAQVNFDPDFTRVGELCREYWSQAGYGDVDGVVAIDPVFLQRILALTGGFTTSDGTTIDGTNCAKVLLSDIYWKYGDDGDAQDAFFASVAAQAFSHIMSNLGHADITQLWDVVKQSGSEGRLLMWMVDENEQACIESLGLDGGLYNDSTTPVLGIYYNDSTYSKMSWYLSSSTVVSAGVKNADGTTTYNVTTTLTNTSTEEEIANAPVYVYGGNTDKRSDSDMLDTIFFFAPAGGTISNIQASDGLVFEDYGIVETSLSGHQVFRTYTHLRAGESGTFTYQVTVSADATLSLAVHNTPLAQESLMQVQTAA